MQQPNFVHMANLSQKGRMMHRYNNRAVNASKQAFFQPGKTVRIDSTKTLPSKRAVKCY